MAEAIAVVGLVTGLIGACDVILRATVKISRYIADVKNAPKELQRLKEEAENLEAVIGAVSGFLSSKKAQRQLGATQSIPINSLLRKCEKFVNGLEGELQKYVGSTRSRLMWPVNLREKTQASVDELGRFTTMLHLSLSLDGWSLFFQSSEAAAAQLAQLRDEMKSVISAVEPLADVEKQLKKWDISFALLADTTNDVSAKISEREDKEKMAARLSQKKELLDFFCGTDGFQRHLDVAKRRQEGTATWFVHSPAVQEWVANPSGTVVWCHGIPGCGKSILFSAVVDHLLEKRDALGCAVAAVYLSHDDSAMHSTQFVLATALRQVADTLYDDDNGREAMESLRRACQTPVKRTPMAKECLDLLLRLAELGVVFYLCFDALDEIPEATLRDVLKTLAVLQKYSNVGLLLASRDHVKLHQLLRVVDVPVSALDTDIRLLLEARIDDAFGSKLHDEAGSQHRMDEDEEREKDKKTLRDEIINGLVAKSKGMFLLADLQIRQLETAVSVREIRELLASQPEELDGQYAVYLGRILGRRQREMAVSILTWIYGSKRHLDKDELLEALSVRTGDTNRDPTGIPSVEVVVKVTEGLVIFDANSRIFRLAHETLRTYLDSHRKALLGSPHATILKTLSTYLHFRTFNETPQTSAPNYWMEIGALQRSHTLLRYTLLSWSYHVDMSQSEPETEASTRTGVRIANRIARSAILRSHVWNVYPFRLPTQVIDADSIDVNTLHIAALFNSLPVAKKRIMELRKDTRAALSTRLGETFAGHTSLHTASISNSVDVAEILLDSGADVGRQDARGRTPIYLAAECGSHDVLEILIRSTRDPEAVSVLSTPNIDLVTPLHAAIRGGYSNCAMTLIQAGAHVDAKTLSEQTPLHYSLQFCPDLAPALLAQTPVGQISSNGRTTLHWACLVGRRSLVEDIGRLTNAADVNSADSGGSMPLHLLTMAKEEQVGSAAYLVSKGADFQVPDKAGFTPLHHAIRSGHFNLAGYLVSLGASPAAAACDGSTPLLAAAARDDCPDNLWEKLAAAEPLPPYGDSKTWPLHQAAFRLNAAEVTGLIQRGASVNAVNAQGESPLYLAACRYTTRKRHSSLMETRSDPVSVLLHHGASPTQTSAETGLSPLHVALVRSHRALLLDMLRFVTPKQLDDASHAFPSGASMLQYAILHSSPACLILLLQFYNKAANPSVQDNDCEPPLALAVHVILRMREPLVLSTVAATPSYRELLVDKAGFLLVPVATQIEHICAVSRHPSEVCHTFRDACYKVLCLLHYGVEQDAEALSLRLQDSFIPGRPLPPQLSKATTAGKRSALQTYYTTPTEYLSSYINDVTSLLRGNTSRDPQADNAGKCEWALAMAIVSTREPHLFVPQDGGDGDTGPGTWYDGMPIGRKEDLLAAAEQRRRLTHLAVPEDGRRAGVRPSMVSEHPVGTKLARYEAGREGGGPTGRRRRGSFVYM